MRKWQWIGILTVALGGVGGYWYFNAKTPTTIIGVGNRGGDKVVDDGDAEASNRIEPLIVDRGRVDVPRAELVVDNGPMPPVVLAPGMEQPPRPDAEPGRVPRMPYADEEECLGLTPSVLTRILEGDLPRLNIFEEFDQAKPPAELLRGHPAADYHHNHCPYHGGCPAPYPNRPMPRD